VFDVINFGESGELGNGQEVESSDVELEEGGLISSLLVFSLEQT